MGESQARGAGQCSDVDWCEVRVCVGKSDGTILDFFSDLVIVIKLSVVFLPVIQF